MVNKYKQGDIIYLDFGPQTGHEQKGERPALIISCNDFNKLRNMVVAAPITSTAQKGIFSFKLNNDTKTKGFVLCDQLKTLDITTRKIRYVESVGEDTINLALSIVRTIFSLQNS